MKKHLLTSAFCILLSALAAPARPVMFPLQSFFRGAQYNRPLTITSAHPWLTDGTNLYTGSFINVTPAGGTNPVVNLQPNDYLLAAADTRVPLRFTVPAGTSVVNILTLINSGVLVWTNWNGSGGGGVPDGTLTTNWYAYPWFDGGTNSVPFAGFSSGPMSRWLAGGKTNPFSGFYLNVQGAGSANIYFGPFGMWNFGEDGTASFEWASGGQWIFNDDSSADLGPALHIAPNGVITLGDTSAVSIGILNQGDNNKGLVTYGGGVFGYGSGETRIHDGGDVTFDNGTGGYTNDVFFGNGSALTFRNAAGARFTLQVNAATNGFNFIRQ